MARREYDIELEINGRRLRKLVVDPHYKVSHSESIDDDVIIQLVHLLGGGTYEYEKIDANGFEYFVEDHMKLAGKLFKLIWLLHEDEIFVGVVNCYRRD